MDSSPREVRRALFLALSTVALLAGVLAARMLLGARAELERAARAHTAGDGETERSFLRRAIAYHLPGNPFSRRAVETLERRAVEADRAGRQKEALEAWRALRGAILALRSIRQPYVDALARANRQVARLSFRPERTASFPRAARREAAHLARLQQPEEPDRAWTAVALLGFVLFLSSALLVAFRGLDAQLRPAQGRFWPLCALLAFSMTLFFVGLARAQPPGVAADRFPRSTARCP